MPVNDSDWRYLLITVIMMYITVTILLRPDITSCEGRRIVVRFVYETLHVRYGFPVNDFSFVSFSFFGRGNIYYPGLQNLNENNMCIHPITSLYHNWPVLFYLSFLLSCLPSAASTSELRTCPYSFTRFGSIRYIHRCLSINIFFTYDKTANINLPDKGRWETQDRLCHPSSLTSHHTLERTTYRKQARRCKKGILIQNLRCMFIFRRDIWKKKKEKSYAKKSSTTVDKVLYIIAFIGICATLWIQ